jgi:hypothetical protein
MVLVTMKQQVLDKINKLTLQTNKHGQYTHNAILLLQKGVSKSSSANLIQTTQATAW